MFLIRPSTRITQMSRNIRFPTMCLGFCLCVSVGFSHLISKWKRYQPLMVSFMLVLLLLLAGKTWNQNRVWLSRESLFVSGVRRMPHNAKVHYNYANFLKDSGDEDLAIHHYRTTLRLDPFYASAHNNIGIILENRTEAEVHFRETLKIAPSHLGAHVNLGNLLFKRGEHSESLYWLYKALKEDDQYVDALVSVSAALIKLGNLTEAAQHLNRAEQISPESKDVYNHYGLLMEKKGDFKAATRYYKKVLEIDQRHSEAMVHAAFAYNQLGNKGRAENLLKQAVLIHRDLDSLEQLAYLYYHTGRVKESLTLYEEIETHYPNTTETLYRYGNILGTVNQYDKAEHVFLRILRLEPDNVEAMTGLSMVLSRQAKYQQSIEYLTTATDQCRLTGRTELLKQIYMERGNNYKDLSKYNEALQDYVRTIELNPNHFGAHANCGAIYHIQGDLEKASHHYKEALRIDPNSQMIKDNILKLERMKPRWKGG